MKRIYISFNYIICIRDTTVTSIARSGVKYTQTASGYKIYDQANSTFFIAFTEISDFFDTELDATKYTNASLLAFLQSYTGCGDCSPIANTPVFYSAESETYFQNTSLVATDVLDMEILPEAGTYHVVFNTQFNTTLVNMTDQAVVDLNNLYLILIAQTVTNPVFPTFAGGSTILSGVYSTAAAVATTGIVTLDGGGDVNSIFLFEVGAAFSTAASSVFSLVNGATPNNVFFVCTGAVTLGANSNVSGTFICPSAAIGIGAGATLNGRAFTQNGAISSSGNIYNPLPPSSFPMGVLIDFAIFAVVGNLTNTGANIIIGSIGTDNGTITGFGTVALSGYIYTPGTGGSLVKCSIYVDGTIISVSTRERINVISKEDIITHAVITVNGLQTVKVKALNSIGISRFYNRILTLTGVQS
jgi:hypothetical protein